MILQELTVRKYGWDVCIFYDATPRYSSVIMRRLWQCGIAPEKFWEAERLLDEGRPDVGLTYTNFRDRMTVIVIGRTSSIPQFCNTLSHEISHLCDHISRYYGIPLESEDNAYMHGDILQQIIEEAAREIGGKFKAAWRYFVDKTYR